MSTLPTVTFHDTTLQVIDNNGEQWLTAADISRALGYTRADAATKIYDRNKAEFDDSMTVTPNLGVTGKPNKTRIFNKRGAHLIAMFSKTEKAAAFRKWVLDELEGGSQAKTALPSNVAQNTQYLVNIIHPNQAVKAEPLSAGLLMEMMAAYPDLALVRREDLNNMMTHCAKSQSDVIKMNDFSRGVVA